jgi:hypothetical protein
MIEVLKQAAEDVSKAYDVLAFAHTERALELLAKTRTSLRQAIAELESQEPVAWVCCGSGKKHDIDFYEDDVNALPVGTMLYTHPPQRTWVGLTDEDAEEVWQSVQTRDFHDCVQPFAQAIEAKLKEKNT